MRRSWIPKKVLSVIMAASLAMAPTVTAVASPVEEQVDEGEDDECDEAHPLVVPRAGMLVSLTEIEVWHLVLLFSGRMAGHMCCPPFFWLYSFHLSGRLS